MDQPTDQLATRDIGIPRATSLAKNANVKHLEYRLNQYSVSFISQRGGNGHSCENVSLTN